MFQSLCISRERSTPATPTRCIYSGAMTIISSGMRPKFTTSQLTLGPPALQCRRPVLILTWPTIPLTAKSTSLVGLTTPLPRLTRPGSTTRLRTLGTLPGPRFRRQWLAAPRALLANTSIWRVPTARERAAQCCITATTSQATRGWRWRTFLFLCMGRQGPPWETRSM